MFTVTFKVTQPTNCSQPTIPTVLYHSISILINLRKPRKVEIVVIQHLLSSKYLINMWTCLHEHINVRRKTLPGSVNFPRKLFDERSRRFAITTLDTMSRLIYAGIIQISVSHVQTRQTIIRGMWNSILLTEVVISFR